MKAAMSQRGVLAGGLLMILAGLPAVASFTSLYCFGDGVCTTTGTTDAVAEYYHEHRYCNGRVWVEVLAQWQGLPYVEANNQSYFGHSSTDLVTNTAGFSAPTEVATALVIVWSANADLVGWINDPSLGYTAGDISAWTVQIDQAVARHVQAVTNLHSKGVRNVVMCHAADVTETPALVFYNDPPSARSFIRARAIQFNVALRLAMDALPGSLSGLTIYQPDVFDFFDQVITNPGDFGLMNAAGVAGSLVQFPNPPQLDGPEADYVFWDEWHPSAKFQMHLAEFVRRVFSPVRITGITVGGGDANLQVENIPLGRPGLIEACANPQGPWQEAAPIDEPIGTGSTTESVAAPATGPVRLYRARFPVVWTWP